MKKTLILGIVMFGFCFFSNAQTDNTTTKAVPISNGCGSESSKGSQLLAPAGKFIDAKATRTSIKTQNESCDQHDKDYYNGVNKEKADNDFQKRSPVMGSVVKGAKETSNKSYQDAQKDRQTSQQLQPTWEREHKQCLDSENYRVTSDK